MKILVTGGAGYIGSFMTKRLLEDGHEVVVVDSLERGHRVAIPDGSVLEEGNLNDRDFLNSVFDKHAFEAVFHFAAYISVAESVREPGKYYSNNVSSTINLLDTMMEHGVRKIIFSSTAAVYGTPVQIPIPESHQKKPESPYGHSKLMIEEILHWYRNAYELSYVALRYFNASGGALDGNRGESHEPETHLIPSAILACLQDKEFTLYGADYDTPDGTCIRDYIHVLDLIEAHVLALQKITKEIGGYTYNVGTGKGFSNSEVVESVKKIAGKDLRITMADRRPGDPSQLIAEASKIQSELGFTPKYSDLHTIVESAWKWHSSRSLNEPKT